MWNLKRNDTNELTQQRSTDLENKFMVTRGEGWGKRLLREFGMDMHRLLYLTCIRNKDLLYRHRELCSTLCGILNGRGV